MATIPHRADTTECKKQRKKKKKKKVMTEFSEKRGCWAFSLFDEVFVVLLGFPSLDAEVPKQIRIFLFKPPF